MYLFPCCFYKGAAFCQVWGDVSVWKVQNLNRLIDKQIWVEICHSISHIENMRHLMEEKTNSFNKQPLALDLSRRLYLFWPKRSSVSTIDDKTWVSEGAERDPARVLTERNEETRKMKGNEVTWKKTDGSNWFYRISHINVAELRGFSESYIFVLLFKYNILLQCPNLTF